MYIATPHNHHFPDGMQALKAGKHVLIEKPFALNLGEGRELQAEAARQEKLALEAMWCDYAPKYDVIRQLLEDGALGDLHTLLADHGEYFTRDHRIFNADLAGANEQAALNKRINELQVALSAATAEKEALIKKAGVVQNNNLQQSQAAARQQIQQLTTQIQQAEAENKRLSASFTTLNKDKHALMTQLAATEKEKQAALEQVKALNADKQPLTTRPFVLPLCVQQSRCVEELSTKS